MIATLQHGCVLVFMDRPILSFILFFCSRIYLKQRMLRMIPCRAVVIRERIPFVFLRLSKLENDQSKFLVVNTNLMNAIALIFGHKPLVFFFCCCSRYFRPATDENQVFSLSLLRE